VTTPSQSSHIKPDLRINPDQYMQDRVIYKMNEYVRASNRHKWWYRVTSAVAIVFAATVPVLINTSVPEIYPTILSLVVTVLVSFEKLFRFREHWRNYDAIAAQLRTEQLNFQTRSGPYQTGDETAAINLFVKNIEERIQNERNETIQMRTREPVGT
jgi:hypothetical protein